MPLAGEASLPDRIEFEFGCHRFGREFAQAR
jgi:hypothetical protein